MRKIFLLMLAAALLIPVLASAKSIRTPAGNFPRVQWAVVEAKPGCLEKISEIGARVLAATSAKESGTYALYGVVEKNNPDLMRLLEIYESNEAYRIHSTSPAFQTYRAERFQYLKGLKLLPVNAIVLEQKDKGTGTFVTTAEFRIRAENLLEFQNLVAAEYVRAVKAESAALGMFLTAEQANPNIFHVMKIFKDETSYSEYVNSADYQNLRHEIQPMIQAEKITNYQPVNITLTQKGSRK